MAATTRRDLFLQVSGNVDSLTTALKAGKSSLAEFGAMASTEAKVVREAIASMGGGNVAAGAKALEDNYRRAFANIQQNARSVIAAGSGGDAFQILNANAARDAAQAAETGAVALRRLADAAATVSARAGEAGTAEKAYAVAAAYAAQGAEEQAVALRDQARMLSAVEMELGTVTNAQRRSAMASGEARIGMQQLGYQLGDVATMYAGGARASQIFATQSGQVIQAISLIVGGAGAASTAFTIWLPIISALAVALVPLAGHLMDGAHAAEQQAKAIDLAAKSADTFGNAQSMLGQVMDITTGKMKTQNKVLIEMVRLQAEAARLAGKEQEGQARKDLAGLTRPTSLEVLGASFRAQSNPGGYLDDLKQRYAPVSGVIDRFSAGKLDITQARKEIEALAAAGKLAGKSVIDVMKALGALGTAKSQQTESQNVIDALDGKGLSPDLVPYKAQPKRKQRADSHNDQGQFDQQLAQLRGEELDTRSGMARDVREQAMIEHLKIDQAVAAYQQMLADRLNSEGLTKAQRGRIETENKTLSTERDRLASKQRAAVNAKLDDKLGAQDLDVAERELEGRKVILQLAYDLATTNGDRKRIAQQILSIEETERRLRAQAVLNNPRSTEAERGAASDELKQIGKEHAPKEDQIRKAHPNPLEEYKDQLERNVGDMNTALKGVEADGLRSLEDGLVGLIDGTESVASAFKKMADAIIADIARIVIEKAILSYLGLSDGGPVTGKAQGGGIGFAAGGIPGFASGVTNGRIFGPGSGTSDSILALVTGGRPIRVSAGESIVTADATRRYGPLIEAMNRGGLRGFADGGIVPDDAIYYPAMPSAASLSRSAPPVIQHFHLHAEGAVMTDQLLAEMDAKANAAAQRGAQGGFQLVADQMQRNYGRLPGSR